MDPASQTPYGDCPPIAMVAPGEIFGGAERQIITLARGLLEGGARVEVALFYDRELARSLRSLGIAVTIVESTLDVARAWLPELSPRLPGFVLHVHGHRAMVAATLGRLTRRYPLVKTEHGLPEPVPSLKGKLLSACHHVAADLCMMATSTRVVYVTKDLAAARRMSGFICSQSIIYNGIEELNAGDFLRPPDMGRDQVNISWIGRFDQIKRLDIALRAMNRLRASHDAVLHVIGSGPLESEWRSLTSKLGLCNVVRFHGHRADARAFLAHSDILLISSDHEGLPYVLLEAMTLGVAIAATRVGGVAEVLDGRNAAMLFAPGDPMGAAKAMELLCRDRGTRDVLGQEAKVIARQRLSAKAMTDEYVSLYRSAAVGTSRNF